MVNNNLILQHNLDFELSFNGFDTIRTESSNIIINYDILKRTNPSQVNEFIKIIQISYILNLHLINKDNNMIYKEFLLENEYSYESNFVDADEIQISKSLQIDSPSQIWDKIVKAHFKKNYIILKINTWIKYELFRKIKDQFVLIDPNNIINKFIHDENLEHAIKLDHDKITELMNTINVLEKMRIEIPIYHLIT